MRETKREPKWFRIYLSPIINTCITIIFIYFYYQKVSVNVEKYNVEQKELFDGIKTILGFLIGFLVSATTKSILDADNASKLEIIESVTKEIRDTALGSDSFSLNALVGHINFYSLGKNIEQITIFSGYTLNDAKGVWNKFKESICENPEIKVTYVYLVSDDRNKFVESIKEKESNQKVSFENEFKPLQNLNDLPAANFVAVKYTGLNDSLDLYEIFAIFPSADLTSAICVHTKGAVKQGFFNLFLEYRRNKPVLENQPAKQTQPTKQAQRGKADQSVKQTKSPGASSLNG